MSADNFNHVRRRVDGLWGVWLNLSASCDLEPQLACEPHATFDDVQLAISWTNDQGDVEYGTRVEDDGDDLRRGSLKNQVRSKHGDADAVAAKPRFNDVRDRDALRDAIRLAVLDGALAEWETR